MKRWNKQLESFEKLDKNKDGYITLKELQKGLGKEYTLEDAKKIMDSVDTDRNEAIDYNEFLAATLDAEIAKNIKKLEMAFRYFDKNEDGYIDGQELKESLEKRLAPIFLNKKFAFKLLNVYIMQGYLYFLYLNVSIFYYNAHFSVLKMYFHY